MKYEIEITGYGGEIAMGKLTKEQYDFWIDHADRESEELHSHLFGIHGVKKMATQLQMMKILNG